MNAQSALSRKSVSPNLHTLKSDGKSTLTNNQSGTMGSKGPKVPRTTANKKAQSVLRPSIQKNAQVLSSLSGAMIGIQSNSAIGTETSNVMSRN